MVGPRVTATRVTVDLLAGHARSVLSKMPAERRPLQSELAWRACRVLRTYRRSLRCPTCTSAFTWRTAARNNQIKAVCGSLTSSISVYLGFLCGLYPHSNAGRAHRSSSSSAGKRMGGIMEDHVKKMDGRSHGGGNLDGHTQGRSYERQDQRHSSSGNSNSIHRGRNSGWVIQSKDRDQGISKHSHGSINSSSRHVGTQERNLTRNSSDRIKYALQGGDEQEHVHACKQHTRLRQELMRGMKLSEILSVCERQWSDFTPANCALAIHCVAKAYSRGLLASGQRGKDSGEERAAALRVVNELMKQLLVGSGLWMLESRQIANLFHAHAQLNARPRHELLLILSKLVEDKIATFNASDHTKVLAAFASTGAHPGKRLLDIMQSHALQRVQDFTPLLMSWALQSLLKMGEQPNRHFLEGIKAELCSLHQELNTHEVINLLVSFARVKQAGTPGLSPEDPVFVILRGAVFANAHDFSAQNVANAAHSFAVLGHPGDGVMRVIAQRAVQLAPSFNSQNISNVVWAFSTLGVNFGKELTDAMVKRALEVMPTFSGQGISNTCWAFANMREEMPKTLLQGFSERTRESLHMFNQQTTSNFMWSLAVMGTHPGSETMSSLEAHCIRIMDTLDSQSVANVLWAYIQLGVLPSQELLQRISERASHLAGSFSFPSATLVLWACASMAEVRAEPEYVLHAQALDPLVCIAVADLCKHEASEVLPDTVGMLAWSSAVLGLAASTEMRKLLDRCISANGGRLGVAHARSVHQLVLACQLEGVAPIRVDAALSAKGRDSFTLGLTQSTIQQQVAHHLRLLDIGRVTEEAVDKVSGYTMDVHVELFLADGEGARAVRRDDPAISIREQEAGVSQSAVTLRRSADGNTGIDADRAVHDAHSISNGEREACIGHMTGNACSPNNGNEGAGTLGRDAPAICTEIDVACSRDSDGILRTSGYGNTLTYDGGPAHNCAYVIMNRSGADSPQNERYSQQRTQADPRMGSLGIAVEIDGPSHFLSGAGRGTLLCGGTGMKCRHLRALGYHVVSVRYWEWDVCMLKGTQEAFLRRALGLNS